MPPEAVAKAAFQQLTKLQDHPPHIQAAAAAAVFLFIIERHKANAQDVMQAVKNLLRHDMAGVGRKEAFGAIRDYMRYEHK